MIGIVGYVAASIVTFGIVIIITITNRESIREKIATTEIVINSISVLRRSGHTKPLAIDVFIITMKIGVHSASV